MDKNHTHYSAPEMVDLGLPSGLKWAKCNIGARRETDYGLYFKWGEVEGRTNNELEHFDERYQESFTDAATAAYGEDYRMPTKENFEELVNYTNHTVETINGVKGFKFTNKTDSDRYIFIPFAGYCHLGSFCAAGSIATLCSSTPGVSGGVSGLLMFENYDPDTYETRGRCGGFSIRAVSEIQKSPENVSPCRDGIKNVVFDFGAVLVRWDQHVLYDRYFAVDNGNHLSEAQAKTKADFFLNNICTTEWAARIDKGESFDHCVKELVSLYPEWKNAIEAYRDRWFEMLPSEVEGMKHIVNAFKEKGYRVYGLSNWSAETFEEATRRFPVLNLVSDRVISGEVGMVKPDADIFNYLFDKYNIDPHESLFIDDSIRNVQTAEQLGMYAIRFTSADDLLKENLINQLLNKI